MPGPCVGDFQDDHAAVGSNGDGGRSAAGRVDADIGQQVVDHLTHPRRVRADHGRRGKAHIERSVGFDDPGGVDRGTNDPNEVLLRRRQRLPLVEPGKEEQLVDQLRHPLGFHSIPRIARARSAGRWSAPRRNSSA